MSRDDSEFRMREIIKVQRRAPSRRVSTVSHADKVELKKSKKHKTINGYKIAGTLGSGSYAKVLMFVDKKTGAKYAAKCMNKTVLKKRRYGPKMTAYDAVKEELKVLETIEHPNLIWLHEVIDDPQNEEMYLVTEYYSGGSLGTVIRKLNGKSSDKELAPIGKRKGLGAWQVRLYFIDMLRALHYIHNVLKVVHKDIKPDNIMIGHNQEAILIDFGVAVQM